MSFVNFVRFMVKNLWLWLHHSRSLNFCTIKPIIMPTTLIQNPDELQLNNQNEIDQILGNPPSWLLHWGISLLFVTVLIFAALAWFIKYPDTISAEAQLLTENPAIRIMPLASGKLEKLFVANQQRVEKGTLLAIVESATNYQDVEHLEKLLNQLNQVSNPKDYLSIQPVTILELGMMQNNYARLVQQIGEYQYFVQQTTIQHKMNGLQEQIIHTKAINQTLQKQQTTLEKEVLLAKNNLVRNQKLLKEGVISRLDLEQIETTYLQYQRQLDNFQTQMIGNKVQIEQLQTQIIDLQQVQTDGHSTRQLTIKEITQNLSSQIKDWQQNYLITAPINGKINLEKIWSENQFVTTGEALLTIVPEMGTGKIIAKAKLPFANSGKVKVGQTVNLSLNGYPYQEFGILKAEVAQIALVPQEEFYSIELKMPNELITTYNKTIPFTQEMQGTADIITEDRRILQRVFDRFWSLLKNT